MIQDVLVEPRIRRIFCSLAAVASEFPSLTRVRLHSRCRNTLFLTVGFCEAKLLLRATGSGVGSTQTRRQDVLAPLVRPWTLKCVQRVPGKQVRVRRKQKVRRGSFRTASKLTKYFSCDSRDDTFYRPFCKNEPRIKAGTEEPGLGRAEVAGRSSATVTSEFFHN